jgi:hypothetical protein
MNTNIGVMALGSLLGRYRLLFFGSLHYRAYPATNYLSRISRLDFHESRKLDISDSTK